jgi:hypothetical protein
MEPRPGVCQAFSSKSSVSVFMSSCVESVVTAADDLGIPVHDFSSSPCQN